MRAKKQDTTYKGLYDLGHKTGRAVAVRAAGRMVKDTPHECWAFINGMLDAFKSVEGNDVLIEKERLQRIEDANI